MAGSSGSGRRLRRDCQPSADRRSLRPSLSPTPMRALCLLALALAAVPASAQWTNRYPAVPGYSHHVYLEGFDLPTLSAGITDPAPSPDGRTVALASRGWLWLMDVESGVAQRVTAGPAVDAQPVWSPDGRTLAFTRDDSRETWIVALDVETGDETIVASAPGLELDPAWTPDGEIVYAAAGDRGIALRRARLGGASEVVTSAPGLALVPQPTPDGRGLVYLAKQGGDQIRLRDLATGDETVVYDGDILSQTRPALSPDGRHVAFAAPLDDGWALVVAGTEAGSPTLCVAASASPALSPAWSADGAALFYAQADADERMQLMTVPAFGGTARAVEVTTWDWGAETGTVTIRTTVDGQPAPARLAISTDSGHPLVGDGQAWFDGQNGVVYLYSPGDLTVTAPAGTVRVHAVQGLETPVETAEVEVTATPASVTLALERVWDAQGWRSGDQHFHLNYGGPYALDLLDLLPVLAGEGLDEGTPLAANLHTRYVDDERWGETASGGTTRLTLGQEVRSHFFGHVGLVGTRTLFDPWIWGPGYEILGRADRENADVTAHARREGGIATYVHPVGVRDPFEPGNERVVPVSLVADGVLGDLDGLEVVCLWTDDLGTSQLWYRLLNLGRRAVPMAGSDVMSNFYRTMAPGTARAYVKTASDTSADFFAGLGAGQSFVTTGPMLDATIDAVGPGGTVGGGRQVSWSAMLASAVPVDRVEVVVNGQVVDTRPGVAEAGRRTVGGTVALPEAGWVAVRAVGPESGWPSMAAYAFAHTAPVWIGAAGSVDPGAQRQAARDLARVLDASQARFEAAYDGVAAPKLRARFARARSELARLAE